MSISYNPASNVALPLFGFGDEDYQYFSFDKNNLLYIASYTTDTVVPPTYLKTPKKLYVRSPSATQGLRRAMPDSEILELYADLEIELVHV